MSVQSDKLMLIMPDTIRPLKPRINGFKVRGNVVDLQLLPSTSPDVKEYRLLRRNMGQESWSPIHIWNRKEFKKDWRDTSVVAQASYQYMLIAADSAGNISDMDKSLSVRVVPIESRDDVKNLRAAFNKGKKMVTLDWDKPNSPVDHYIVYRGKDGQLPAVFSKADADATHFEDVTYPGNGKYMYLIKVIYKDLSESPYAVSKEIITN
jgi:fibronectin type 3 domain-containing protein